ncbi:mechanosensitive ion channel family protein [uncultured Marinobacter sp.]|uniref:mechanosensitive ion channel family protein n=1 Tax=uncultured Marinobacter sp. TaxID=187379 RepID=UPI0030D79F4E
MSGLPWAGWLAGIALFAAGFVLATLASRSVARFMLERSSRHHAAIVRRLVYYVILVLFTIAGLREAGFAPDVILGAAGILTVAIGFASQTSASNMISGIFLMVEKPFEIGNLIDVDGTMGEVVAIDMLSVKLRTPDNLYVRIPNETLIKTKVVNRSRFAIRRLDIKVGIAYAEDIDRARSLLLGVAGQSPLCLQEPKPFLLVLDFGASSIDLQLSCWIQSIDTLTARSELMIGIKQAFDSEGIEIPFPHTSVYAGAHSEPFRIELTGDGVPVAEQTETQQPTETTEEDPADAIKARGEGAPTETR